MTLHCNRGNVVVTVFYYVSIALTVFCYTDYTNTSQLNSLEIHLLRIAVSIFLTDSLANWVSWSACISMRFLLLITRIS